MGLFVPFQSIHHSDAAFVEFYHCCSIVGLQKDETTVHYCLSNLNRLPSNDVIGTVSILTGTIDRAEHGYTVI